MIITNIKTAASQVKDGFAAIISPMDKESVANNIIRLVKVDKLKNTLSGNAYLSDYSNSRQLERISCLIDGE